MDLQDCIRLKKRSMTPEDATPALEYHGIRIDEILLEAREPLLQRQFYGKDVFEALRYQKTSSVRRLFKVKPRTICMR